MQLLRIAVMRVEGRHPMRWWKRDLLRRQGRTTGTEDAATSCLASGSGDAHSALRSRYEVCPPSLLHDDPDPRPGRISSLLPQLTTVVRWLQTGWYSTDPGANRRELRAAPLADAGDERLQQARSAFLAVIADLQPPAATELANRVHAAPTLRELWHLRNALFTQVSIDLCESVALARLAELNRFFVVRDHAPRPRRRFGTRTDGFDPHRPSA